MELFHPVIVCIIFIIKPLLTWMRICQKRVYPKGLESIWRGNNPGRQQQSSAQLEPSRRSVLNNLSQ